MRETLANLVWVDGRWHLHGRGVHAGDTVGIQLRDHAWRECRIESRDCGQRLFAHFLWHEEEVVLLVKDHHLLRWER